MCGIVGYVGGKQAQGLIMHALKRLEYRGYDSAGLAVIDDGLEIFKDKGEIDRIIELMPEMKGNLGIGHTRWATHGPPVRKNAHPFKDCKDKFAVVHNGIIENFMSLKEELIGEGHKFTSDTDTEVVAHLLEKHYSGDLEETMKVVVSMLKGSYAIVAIAADEPDKIVAARMISPLILGIGENENFVASDVPAVLEYTDRMVYLLDGEIATVTSDNYKIQTFDGEPVEREWDYVDMTLDGAEKGGYEHFMLKEIFEQPKAIHNTLIGAGSAGSTTVGAGSAGSTTIGAGQDHDISSRRTTFFSHFHPLFILSCLLFFNPGLDFFFTRNLADAFNFPINDYRGGAENTVAGDFHDIGYLLHRGIHAGFSNGFFYVFFGLLTFWASGAQYFNIHVYLLFGFVKQLNG